MSDSPILQPSADAVPTPEPLRVVLEFPPEGGFRIKSDPRIPHERLVNACEVLKMTALQAQMMAATPLRGRPGLLLPDGSPAPIQ